MAGFPQRKVDPDRFRHIDSVPEGAEGDADYKRAVEELESGIMQRAGWLGQTGAFDKGDLLYLRDQEEREKHLAGFQEAREAEEFARARSALDEEAEARAGAVAAAAKLAAAARRSGEEAARRRKVLPVVRVKKAGAAAAAPAAKRPRAESGGGSGTAEREAGNEEPAEELPAAADAGSASEGSDGGAGLGGLLGGYGSDSEGSGAEGSGDEKPA